MMGLLGADLLRLAAQFERAGASKAARDMRYAVARARAAQAAKDSGGKGGKSK